MEYVVKSPEHWKIGFSISESGSSSQTEPVVLLTVPLENGGEKVIEMSIKMFHVLRQRTALLTKYLISLQEQ